MHVITIVKKTGALSGSWSGYNCTFDTI